MSPQSLPARRTVRIPRELRRAQVLRVAQDLFTSEGYHHVSMDDIADRVKVTKPVLYRHFPSKLDLYLTIVDDRGADLVATMDRTLAESGESTASGDDGPTAVVAVITAVVRAYLEFVDDTGETSTLLFESDVRHDVQVRARVEQATAAITDRLHRTLTAAGMDPATAAIVTPCLTVMAQEAAMRRLRSGDRCELSCIVDLLARVAWGGIRHLLGSAEGERRAPDQPRTTGRA